MSSVTIQSSSLAGTFAVQPSEMERQMNEDKFNMALRKFLKQVGVTSQREIERIARDRQPAGGKLKLKMVLTATGTDLNHVVEQEIDLG
jgi:hypothetical protein